MPQKPARESKPKPVLGRDYSCPPIYVNTFAAVNNKSGDMYLLDFGHRSPSYFGNHEIEDCHVGRFLLKPEMVVHVHQLLGEMVAEINKKAEHKPSMKEEENKDA